MQQSYLLDEITILMNNINSNSSKYEKNNNKLQGNPNDIIMLNMPNYIISEILGREIIKNREKGECDGVGN